MLISGLKEVKEESQDPNKVEDNHYFQTLETEKNSQPADISQKDSLQIVPERSL